MRKEIDNLIIVDKIDIVRSFDSNEDNMKDG